MTASPDASVVIIGAGHAGSGLAAILRQSGFAGSLTIIGDERHLPYHRPPLSKKFDSSDVEQLLRPREFYVENNIDLRVGQGVRSIDLNTRVVATDSGSEIEYSTLVFATGSTPRSLPGVDPALAGVHTLRSLDDAHDLSESLARGGALVIVGGGYVGMEVAAVARSQGTPVTVIEREDRLLARVASAELSSMLADYHTQRGVTIRIGQSISGLRNW
ncbi:NAD(P)/FAD-dependent oxidoreductase, partial [Gordonia aichiensis]